MGMDIYLRWKGITDAEKRKQYTGYRTVGKYGYLRIAYTEPLSEGRVLVRSLICGKEHPKNELFTQKDVDYVKQILSTFKEKHSKVAETGCVYEFDAKYELWWIKQAIQFLELGCKKQKLGLKPYVDVS